MVCNSLKVGQNIREDKAKLDAAKVLLKTNGVVALDLVTEGINYLLKRLNCKCFINVAGFECIKCDLKNLTDSCPHCFKLLSCLRREGDLLVADFLCRLNKVDRVVGDSFKVADHVEELCNLNAVNVVHITRRKLNKVRADNVLIDVYLVLLLAHIVGDLVIKRVKKVK